MARRRSSSGWLAWWLAPVGSGARRARPRSRGASWWLQPVGSSSRRTPAATGTVATPRARRPRVADGEHCPVCGKGARCTCRRRGGEPIRRKRLPTGQRYAYPPDFRSAGVIWCGACRHRINPATGHCLNSRCPR